MRPHRVDRGEGPRRPLTPSSSCPVVKGLSSIVHISAVVSSSDDSVVSSWYLEDVVDEVGGRGFRSALVDVRVPRPGGGVQNRARVVRVRR